MARFVEPAEMRSRTKIPEVLNLDDDSLDDLYLYPAERIIENRFNLTINTDDEPTHWAGIFDSRPAEKTKFLNDYRRAVFILVNYMATNPGFLDSQSMAGSSVTFAKGLPYAIEALMEKWGNAPSVYRV